MMSPAALAAALEINGAALHRAATGYAGVTLTAGIARTGVAPEALPALLARELAAYWLAFRAEPRWRQALERVAGLPGAAFAGDRLGVGGVWRIEVEGAGTWSPHAEVGRLAFSRGQPGQLAVIVPVFDHVPASREQLAPVLVDLLALDPRDPAQWWHRTGLGRYLGTLAAPFDPVAGEDGKGGAGALRMHRTPLGWLQAGADPAACCLLDLTDRDLVDLAAYAEPEIPALVGDDEAHAAELYKWLRPAKPRAPRRPGIEFVVPHAEAAE